MSDAIKFVRQHAEQHVGLAKQYLEEVVRLAESRSPVGTTSDCTQPVVSKGNSGSTGERDTIKLAEIGLASPRIGAYDELVEAVAGAIYAATAHETAPPWDMLGVKATRENPDPREKYRKQARAAIRTNEVAIARDTRGKAMSYDELREERNALQEAVVFYGKQREELRVQHGELLEALRTMLGISPATEGYGWSERLRVAHRALARAEGKEGR